jgi:catechol 2,3-dioxygenase-like lactoylglutathione lyase family enzyme
MLDHIAIQCSDLDASVTFYEAVLPVLGAHMLVDGETAKGFGVRRPTFWLGPHRTGEGFRESHIAFSADGRDAVVAFFQAAARAGAEVLYEPSEWPQYHPGYYAAFVRDPDGNNVEAVFSGYTA